MRRPAKSSVLLRFAVLLVLAIAALGWPSLNSANASVAVPIGVQPIYTYDAPTYDVPENHAALERGPPVTGYANTSYDTVDVRSHGSSARLSGSGPRATYDYGDTALLVQSDIVTDTTNVPARAKNGDLSASKRLQVAAKSADTVVLGHYPEYVDVAKATGGRTFQVPTKVWDSMSPTEQWAANQKFLDRAIARGSNIQLATPANAAREGSYFERELQYMQSQGYTVSPDGMSLIAPGGP